MEREAVKISIFHFCVVKQAKEGLLKNRRNSAEILAFPDRWLNILFTIFKKEGDKFSLDALHEQFAIKELFFLFNSHSPQKIENASTAPSSATAPNPTS